MKFIFKTTGNEQDLKTKDGQIAARQWLTVVLMPNVDHFGPDGKRAFTERGYEVTFDKTGFFETDNENIARALEKHPRFGLDFVFAGIVREETLGISQNPQLAPEILTIDKAKAEALEEERNPKPKVFVPPMPKTVDEAKDMEKKQVYPLNKKVDSKK